LRKGLNNTANAKEGTDGPNWRRLTQIAIGGFEKLLGAVHMIPE